MSNYPEVENAILQKLRERKDSGRTVGYDVAALTRAIGGGVSSTMIAIVCSELANAGLIVGDGNLMGFVSIADAGYQRTVAMEQTR